MSELKVGNSVKLNLNNKETVWVEVKEGVRCCAVAPLRVAPPLF